MAADMKSKMNQQNGLTGTNTNNNTTDCNKTLNEQYPDPSLLPPPASYDKIHQFPLVKNFPEVKFCNLSDHSSSIGALSSSTINNTKFNYNNLTPTSASAATSTTKGITNLNGTHNNNNNGNLNYNTNEKKHKRLISDDSADSITLSSTEKKKPGIPDGGYGWVVVFASLMVSLIADGVSFSFGLIYTELNSYFKESKTKTAWVSSLFLAIPLLVGPIMSNLVDKYGCRRMTLIGGVVSASGFALGSICNSIEMLYLTFGVISGLGLGMYYLCSFYFSLYFRRS